MGKISAFIVKATVPMPIKKRNHEPFSVVVWKVYSIIPKVKATANPIMLTTGSHPML